MNTVLITGITGFLGSNIAETLIANNFKVIGLKREFSNIWRCSEFSEKVKWIDIDDNNLYIKELKKLSFDTIIHAAWIGVEANDRDNWANQSRNIPFLIDLLEISKTAGVKKFIFLGSQAEYGSIIGKIDESHESEPLSAYGAVKLACLEILKTYSHINKIDWVWLRIFSIYGEKQDENWLIPSLIKSIKMDHQKDFTLGMQKYAYLYVNDFSEIIKKIIVTPINSGIYNISSNNIKTIKSLIEDVKNYINPDFILNFGAIEYRENQSMHIEGDITKLITQIGEVQFTEYSIALTKTLNYYLNK